MHFLRWATLFCAAATVGTAGAQSGNIAVNQTGAAADEKAILDVSSTEMGLLIPRMSQAQKNAIAAPPDGLVVFQHNGPAAEPRGFYVRDQGVWQPLLQGMNGWDIWGNYLMNRNAPTPDFIGTTDARSMMFRTNNIHRMQLDYTTGYLAVGHPINTTAAGAAKERLDINGALGIYYARPAGSSVVPPSQTAAAGVIRYQPYGTATGTAPYRYGTYELGPTNPNNAATWLAVLGSNKYAPLMHAAHWGNINGVDTTRGKTVGTVPVTITQPELGGWRAFENPYEERIGMTWDHFREAVCAPGGSVNIPYGWGQAANGAVMSNTATVPAADRDLVTPYNQAAICIIRKQYLFFPDELNGELAQVAGVTPTPTGGLCPGEPINSIGFYVNGNYTRALSAASQGHIIVRNAPIGLDQLVGFDNTPDATGTMGCGAIWPATWPDATGGHWQTVNLTTPFIWDGKSNVIVEVAAAMAAAGFSAVSAPVAVRELAVPVTYSATATSATGYTPLLNPAPGPGWACPNLFDPVANTGLLLPDFHTSNYKYGSSRWRPVIQFGGTVATFPNVNTTGPATGSRYINYPGALVMEDPSEAGRINALSNGLPWGRWRWNFPQVGYPTFNYKGDGTISAQKGIYDNRIRLNDHVFDRTFDGRVAPQEAAEFGDQRNLSIPEMAEFTRRNRHLPTMKGRAEWEEEKGFSVGDLTNQLWTTAETHALYVADLHDKLNLLEILTNDRPLTPAEFKTASKELAAMPEYNDAEKARLIADLRRRTSSLSR